mmetsp:Transcript_40143/g.96240  ORF Transcript_40143/g.96240 Transcript_40143/m.96240 type:complete len:436 (+) Transcript_40143:33-1340(+)
MVRGPAETELLRRLAEPSAVVAIWQKGDDIGEPAVSVIQVVEQNGTVKVVLGEAGGQDESFHVTAKDVIPVHELVDVRASTDDLCVIVKTRTMGTVLLQVQDEESMQKWGLGLRGLRAIGQQNSQGAQTQTQTQSPQAAQQGRSSPSRGQAAAGGDDSAAMQAMEAQSQAMARLATQQENISRLLEENSEKDTRISSLKLQLDGCMQVVQRSADLFKEQEKVVREQDRLIQGLTRILHQGGGPPSPPAPTPAHGQRQQPSAKPAAAKAPAAQPKASPSPQRQQPSTVPPPEEVSEDIEGDEESGDLESLGARLQELLQQKAAAEQMLAHMEGLRSQMGAPAGAGDDEDDEDAEGEQEEEEEEQEEEEQGGDDGDLQEEAAAQLQRVQELQRRKAAAEQQLQDAQRDQANMQAQLMAVLSRISSLDEALGATEGQE